MRVQSPSSESSFHRARRAVALAVLSIQLASPQTAPPATEDPLILQVRVLEGEGMVYATGSRATRGITVEVTDELGKPVQSATVSFRLPEQAASGVFQNGTHTEIATTGPDGRAGVWGMRWNKVPGTILVQIAAVKGQTRAGTTVTQVVSEVSLIPAAQRMDPYRVQSSRKWVWISLVAAGAAGGGLALGARSTKAALAAAPPPVTITIGGPTITIGAATTP